MLKVGNKTSRLQPVLILVLGLAVASPAVQAEDCVIFLHGLARTDKSMRKVEKAFGNHGYLTANIRYPSRRHSVEDLAPIAVEQGIATCLEQNADRIHFVTHSLGGILVRQFLASNTIDRLGRVVMLAPPNRGSEVVDKYRRVPGYKLLNGPAGLQLGTNEDSLPNRLGPVEFSVGVIAGTKTINPILSQFLPNPDDGKVSVERTQVDGMSDFMKVAVSHPFIVRSDQAIEQALVFIETGRFSRESTKDTPDTGD